MRNTQSENEILTRKDLALATAELRGEFSGLRGEFSVVKGGIALLKWMVGFSLALSSAILIKLFLS